MLIKKNLPPCFIKLSRLGLIFFLWIVIIILSLAIVVIFFDIKLWGQLKQLYGENLSNLTRLASSQHEEIIKDTRQLLYLLSHIPEVVSSNDASKCNQILNEIREDNQIYAAMAVLTPTGDILCSSSAAAEGQIINVGYFRDYFQQVLKTGDFIISQYLIGVVSRKPVIILAQPVLDQEQKVSAVLVASLDLDWMNRYLGNINLPYQCKIKVIDKQGIILNNFPLSENLIGESIDDSRLLEIIKQKDEGVVEKRLEKTNKFYIFSKLKGLPEENEIYMVVEMSEEALRAQSKQMILIETVILITIFIIFFLLIYLNFIIIKIKDVQLKCSFLAKPEK